ncbi:MAG TPA: hypothetical protein ENN86_04170 [Desulfobacteraceae bacterium]|nr:hypothetical protein [Desulfobacteraceae bacterium]
MKRIAQISLILTLLFAFNAFQLNAQCKGFAKKICKAELGSYTHDGNYHAAILVEGEEAELYKTFYSDQDYRLAICGSDNLPAVEFTVMDANKNVLYSNADNNYSRTWDFTLESSQQLKLLIKVTTFEQLSDDPASGCVAIMFGFIVD